jgi:hypothetical protein
MQLAGPKEGGLVYTEWDLEVQNGGSGVHVLLLAVWRVRAMGSF